MEWRLAKLHDKWAVRIGASRFRLPVEYGPETKARAETLAAIAYREYIERHIGEAPTIGHIAYCYLCDMPNRTTPRASDRQRWALERILPAVADDQPGSITRETCRAWIKSQRADGRADGTIRDSLGALAAALRWHDANTPARFEMPPASPARSHWLTTDQIFAVIEHASPHVETFIRLVAGTGGRAEAVLGLTWSTHVDFDRGTVWLGFRQGGKGRGNAMPVPDDLMQHLTQAYKQRASDHVIEYRGKPVRSIRNALGRAYERAGVDPGRNPAHILRHTAGARMAMAGVPMIEISRRLGHSSIGVTERHYAHVHPDYMQASKNALALNRNTN